MGSALSDEHTDEGQPSHVVARRFGYSPGAFRVLCHQFRHDPGKRAGFFQPLKHGPQTAPVRDRVRDLAVAMRKKNLSVYDIQRELATAGHPASINALTVLLREEGFAGTTARAIARHGGFNQALIFYHFGSVSNLLQEAFLAHSDEQVAKYREAAAHVSSLSDLVEIARRLHADDLQSGAVTAVTQLMAAASDPQGRRAILDRFDQWIGLVQDALSRAMGALFSLSP